MSDNKPEKDKKLYASAHEIWAAAQLHPDEGIESGVLRVYELMVAELYEWKFIADKAEKDLAEELEENKVLCRCLNGSTKAIYDAEGFDVATKHLRGEIASMKAVVEAAGEEVLLYEEDCSQELVEAVKALKETDDDCM